MFGLKPNQHHIKKHPKMGVIDLNRWHYAVHQVSGGMATHFNRATPEDLQKWAGMLRKVAEEMETAISITERKPGRSLSMMRQSSSNRPSRRVTLREKVNDLIVVVAS